MNEAQQAHKRWIQRAIVAVAASIAFIDAQAADLPPIISGSPPTQVTVGTPYTFQPAASDPEGARLRFTITSRPAWLTFSRTTGLLRGTPTTTGVWRNIRISVSDGVNVRSLPAFTIRVVALPGNKPPTISGSPPARAEIGRSYSFAPTATDADGDRLAFSIENKPEWTSFDTLTGRLSGTPGTAGTHPNIVISVSDGKASAALPAFSIAVAPAGTSTLPTPTALKTTAEDRAVVLEWNGGHADPYATNPSAVAGFQVAWHPKSNPGTTSSKITAYRMLELQPLENGREYVTTVAAIGHDGSLSPASAPLTFTSSAARTEQLRSRMSSFFDDFNLPMGPPDERKWDVAFMLGNDPAQNGFFINDQFHVHNNVSLPLEGVGQTSSRARRLLDLADGGVRTIVFDFDGSFGRDSWYLELAPRQPAFTHEGAQWRQGKMGRWFFGSDVPRGLRIGQSNNDVSITFIGADGGETQLAKGDPSQSGSLPIPNIRRRWEIHVAHDRAEVLIDGKVVAAAPAGSVQLARTQYAVFWEKFSYNGPKANFPNSLHHWDNFGFDGPAGADIVTHNYRLKNGGSDAVESARWRNALGKVQLGIPDSLAGARERRLLFTLSGVGFNFGWEARDRVTINGRSFAIPKPRTAVVPEVQLSSLGSLSPYVFELSLPEGVLRTGANEIVFDVSQATIHNIHVEADFPVGASPSYTPPATALAGNGVPAPMSIGPNVIISRLNGAETWQNTTDRSNPGATPLRAAGVVPVVVTAGNFIAMAGSGAATGIVEVGLVVDGKPVARQATNKTVAPPSVVHKFDWDSRQVADGVHEILGYACNANGAPSIFDVQDAHGISGAYVPMYVRVENHGGSPQIFRAAPAPDLAALCNPRMQEHELTHSH